MILGYDWLELHSPMEVHWSAKWLSIPYENRTAVIQGILFEILAGVVVQVCQLTETDLQLDDTENSVQMDHVPEEIQTLLQKYSDIFASSVQIPSARS
jgi:hypothetical protein